MRLLECSFRPRTRDPMPDHIHEEWEWHYVLGGACGFHIGDRDIRIGPGDCFAIPPGTAHGIRMHKRDDWLLQYIAKSEGDELPQAWQHRAGRKGSLRIGEGRHAFFARLQVDLQHDDPWRKASASHRFAALLCERLAGDGERTVHPAVERALELMRERLRHAVGLDELADLVGLDRSYFSRLFSRELGCAPMRYFLGMKMELAASMLRNSQRTITGIAEAIGFEDPFHFSRRFKRWAGTSPSSYRARHGCVTSSPQASRMR